VLASLATAGVRRAIGRERAERERLSDAGETREMLLASERAARAEAQRASRAKDEFVAVLSHELRTPLNAVMGWTELARRPGQTPEQLDKALAVVDRNARQLGQIIGDMLDMSRILSGKLRVDLDTVELAGVVGAALDGVQSAAAAKGVEIRRRLDRRGANVLGDPSRLQQVVYNLVSNAIKFTPKGGRVDVSVKARGAHVELAVTDTGQGVDPAVLPHLFERFWQADASASRCHGGLGLGLSIVKHLVELHGGTVRAESQGIGKGTRFVVELPLRQELALGAAPAAARRSASELAGARILVVDDEPDAQELLKRVLEDHGAQVVTASSGTEALDVISTRRPLDAVVSDIGMPGMDGYELMRRVRAETPAKDVPAVALTAYARPEDRARALCAGYQAHLAKPVEPAEMLAKVAELIRAPHGAEAPLPG
jgi:signal transduction histidine kinase/ActR/RegA family two-component response regulator